MYICLSKTYIDIHIYIYVCVCLCVCVCVCLGPNVRGLPVCGFGPSEDRGCGFGFGDGREVVDFVTSGG